MDVECGERPCFLKKKHAHIIRYAKCVKRDLDISKETYKRDLLTTEIQYGVATISRLHKIIGLFGRISSLL